LATLASLAALAPAGCGRTVLDAPVDLTDTAGATGHAGSVGAGGSAGHGGAGVAGQGGGPGVAGQGGGAGVGGSPGIECRPNTAVCTSEKTLQICNDKGLQLPPQTCDGACLDGACVGCAEGTTRCASHEGQQTCKGGQWTAATDCEFVCVGEACSKNPRHVFVTSQTFTGGEIGGLTGADDICRGLAVKAGLSSSYFAWLSDSTGSPATRFPEDVGPYILVDGTIVANNWTDLTSGTLRHPIDLTESGGPPPKGSAGCVSPAAWSDTTNHGARAAALGACDDWVNPMASAASFGAIESTSNWSDACMLVSSAAMQVCGGTAPLYCFEQ
jgi:hypothetical protein